MDLFSIATVLIVLSALFGYLNVRFLKLPDTIGMMIIAILFTLGIIVIGQANEVWYNGAKSIVGSIDFKTVLLDIMLGFLLFAGAMHTNFDQLKVQRWPIMLFATFGVLLSTFLIGGLTFLLLDVMGISVKFIECLLFGALISPTDPIAVLGILKKAGVPKKLETKIVGESLFNDGVGVVVFLTILTIAGGSGHGSADAQGIIKLFGQEVLGGLAMGGILGYIAFRLLKSIDDYDTEVIITLATVMGGYLLAQQLHLSAPLAMVVAGLIVGNDTVRDTSMSEITELYLDKFWELIDVLLNAVLFVLIGLELIILTLKGNYILAGVLAIPIALACRYVALFAPIRLFKEKLEFVPHTNTIMTWGGLRGGISIALALSLPESMNRDLFVTMTYVVVVFSIIVQGLTIGGLTKRLLKDQELQVSTDSH